MTTTLAYKKIYTLKKCSVVLYEAEDTMVIP